MQQVNLYQSVLKKPRQWLTPVQLGYALGGLLICLSLMSLAQWWYGKGMQQALQALKQEESQILADLETLTRKLSEVSNTSGMEETLARKEAELRDKDYVLQVLSGRQFGNTSGFAEQFAGLARQTVTGVWLTGLHIHAGGSKLDLRGSTLDAELVPRYLQALGQEPGFNGMEFKTFQMERIEQSSHINFDLRSTPKEPG